MRHRTIGIAVASALLAAAVAGCTQSGGGSSGSASSEAAVNGGQVAAGAAPAGSGVASGAARNEAHLPDAAVVDHVTQAAEIRTADMTVAVKGWQHVAQRADAADAIAARAGGEVTADDRNSGRHASATVVLRVPPADLEATLSALSRLGVEKSRSSSTVDVTQQVADVSSRVASASAAIARLRVLYRQATKVRDVIRIEDELSSREADLESLQARQRALANRTALATITLRLVTAAVIAPKKKPAPVHHPRGFVGGVERGWHAFTTAVGWLALAVGTLLPFLLTLLVLAALGWQLRRRTRRGTVPPPAPMSE